MLGNSFLYAYNKTCFQLFFSRQWMNIIPLVWLASVGVPLTGCWLYPDECVQT